MCAITLTLTLTLTLTVTLTVTRLGELITKLDNPWSPIKLIRPPGLFGKAVELSEEEVDERKYALAEFMEALVIPIRNQGKLHFSEVIVALAEYSEGHQLPEDPKAPDKICKIQKKLLASWPKVS